MEEANNKTNVREKLAEKVKLLPVNPGVYKMFDSFGTVIYVGKAKNLKNRVSQYFRSHNREDMNENKVRAMVSHIADFEYIITKSETEALTLEANLIKQFMPHYNILLKDDKHFPYLRVDIKKDFPTFSVVRKINKDDAKYFGPYMSTGSVNDAITAIRNFFPVRHCKKDIGKAIKRRERPCLMYHIGKCCAPCSGKISIEEYHKLTDKVCDFLNGNIAPIINEMTQKMQIASDEMDFEQAAVLRDRIASIRSLCDKQLAMASTLNRYDVFASYSESNITVCFALFVRDGKIIGTDKYFVESVSEDNNEILEAFIKQYYLAAAGDDEVKSVKPDIPKDILVQTELPDIEAVSSWFSELSGHSVHIQCPKKGDKKALAEMALTNAKEELNKKTTLTQREWDKTGGALVELSGQIGLETVPERIECYDNSHIQGTDMVGTMIVFTEGKPDNKEYRRFRITSTDKGDDYAAMKEMLTRRLKRAREGDGKFSKLPDLIVVDGGKGQLNVALEVLSEFGLDYIPTIGLAEKNEEIFRPGEEMPIVLNKHSAPLHFIQRVRDEAHRFAITYHRSLRSKSALYSVLDSIPGVGDKRKRALFDKFMTVEEIKAASVQQLSEVSGVTKPVAESVYNFFHERGDNQE